MRSMLVSRRPDGGPTRARKAAALLATAALALGVAAAGAPAGAAVPIPPPCSPVAPQVVGASASTLTVDLQPCSLVPVASSYRVSLFVGTATTAASYQDLPVASPRATFTGLSAGTVYRFTVRASNSTWASATSPKSLAATPPFTTVDAFTTQQHQDLTGSAPSSAQLTSWRTSITNGTLTPAAAIGTLIDSAYWQVQSPVTRLYIAYFGRLPDPSGLTYWTNRTRTGTTLATVSANFAGSSEFQNTYGPLNNGQFVDLAYQNVFHRAPDPSGGAYWLNKLNTGTSRSEMMLTLSQSNEFKNDTAVQVDLVNIYTGLLRRTPTAAEATSWGTTPRAVVIVALLGGASYEARVQVVAPVVRAAAYDDLFTRYEKPVGVTQGDGARSTLLPDGRVYWSMGDSNVGTLTKTWPGSDGTYRRVKPDGSFDMTWLHNTVVTTGGTAGFQSFYKTDPATGEARDFFPPSGLPAGHSFWPAAAVVEGTGSSAVLRSFLMDVGYGDAANPDRRLIRSLDPSTLAQVGPTLTPPSPLYTDPSTGHAARILFGNAILEDGSYTYVYGQWSDPDCTDIECFLAASRTFVARTTTGNLTNFTSWRYYSGGSTWSASAANPVSVADHPIDSVVKSDQGYLTFVVVPAVGLDPATDPMAPAGPTNLPAYNPDQVQNNQLVVYRASSPTGPWNTFDYPQPVAAYDIPEDPSIGAVGRYSSYLPQAHPAVHDPANPNRILVGWSNDRVGGTFADLPQNTLYRPRFIWLDLSKL
ncbi:DUF4214 domain-containing protein [Aquihabitans sp. G128]|uniref:DUF4214 domain-containing protein n=1 Tax=Aquihabitans sp. G128 TaxID=2849779 RepID=UPI001C24DF24|nr:DUF4214 domain-containing protein [Aquihabitans sp. G128]QXC59376.1 DUF4214 domain-containing protein [Aquihabitans sp. G128]